MKDIKGKSWWKFAKICLPSSIGTAAYVSLVRSLVPSQSTRPHHLSDPLPVHSCLSMWQRIFKFNIPMDKVHARAKFQIRCLHNLLGLVIFVSTWSHSSQLWVETFSHGVLVAAFGAEPSRLSASFMLRSTYSLFSTGSGQPSCSIGEPITDYEDW